MNILRMTDLDLSSKRVLIRPRFNVPIKDGEVTSDNTYSRRPFQQLFMQ
jgi:phosphoglycerate kinase